MAKTTFFTHTMSGVLLILSGQAIADDNFFNPALLEIDHPTGVDISQFNRANTLPAGVYNVDIYINSKMFERRDVKFSHDNEDQELYPCFISLKETLASMGVKVKTLPSLNDVDEKSCVNPVPLITGSTWLFDGQLLRLNITIPQIYLDMNTRDYISPTRWDEGINALMVNYDFSGSHTLKADYSAEDSNYLNIRNGLNIGAWRLRNYSTLNITNGDAEYHSINTWLQRNIPSLRSQIMLGDTWTASDIFDSTQIRGVRLYTDNDMLPVSQNSFSPVVHGIAKTNATVIIRQNNYIIYQTAVPQGAFAITDLNTVSSGGDLDITIKEEDGTEQHFTQPYASLAVLKREGQTDIDFSIGELRNDEHHKPGVMQAQVIHGLPKGITLYSGVQLAEDYSSFALGIGKDLGRFGAASLDVTHAQAQFDDAENETGQSYRFLYSKFFNDTDTSIRLVGYRYSTEGYYTLDEWSSRYNNQDDFWQTGNRRSRVEGTLTQSFVQGYGNVYLTLSRQEYWHTNNIERLIQFGYSNSWNSISWNISWSYSDMSSSRYESNNTKDNGNEQIYMLSLSVPLSGWLNNSFATYSVTQNDHTNSSHQVGLSGTMLERNNISYNLTQSYTSDDDTAGGSLALTYDGTYGSVNSSYNYDRNVQRLNYGARGGILAHSEGITFSQELGDTVALIKAPGASGLDVENTTGVATDWRGFTVKTQLSPYSENRIAISNSYFLNENVELDNSVVNIVPTRGAVVKAEFLTHIGSRVFFTLLQDNGKPVPFGAMASVDSGSVGIVGDNGELYLSGLSEQGKIKIVWGDSASKNCTVDYIVNESEGDAGLIQQDAICR